MHKKAEAKDALNRVVQEYGIPKFGLHTDNAREESSNHNECEKVHKHFLIPQTLMEPYNPWMHQAEGEIGWMNCRIMNCHQWPKTVWCFGMEYTSALCKWIAHPGQNGLWR